MLVDDLMTRGPVQVTSSTPAGACALLMARREIRHLPVVDEGGRLLGMLIDAVLARRGALVGEDPLLWVPFDPADAAATAADLMGRVECRARAGTDLAQVIAALLAVSQDAALVCDAQDRLVGILTEHDIVRYGLDAIPTEMRAEHVASTPAVAVDARKDARQAWDRMVGAGIRHVLVTVGGRLDGVISLRDLVADDVPGGQYRLDAGDVVRRRPPISARMDTPLLEIVQRMRRDRIGCVPIVDEEDHPLGVVTRTDIGHGIVAALEDEALFAPQTDESEPRRGP